MGQSDSFSTGASSWPGFGLTQRGALDAREGRRRVHNG